MRIFRPGPVPSVLAGTASQLATESLGRSHRSKIGKARLKLAIDLTREILNVPSTHRIGIVPASDTGAYEMAMWSLLGARPATMLAWESFGEGWVTDAIKQLKIDADVVTAPYGELPDLSRIDQSRDICFTWNGTTSGVRVPNGEWIRDDREGLNLVDATSGVFAQDIPWAKVDVLTYSLAEGARRRRRPWRAHPRPARRRTAGKLHPGLAAAEDFPADLEGQADRRHLQRRNDQHAVDAGGRGLYRRAGMVAAYRRPARTDGARRCQCDGAQ